MEAKIYLQTFALMELVTQRFQPRKGDERSAGKMSDAFAVNMVFVCIVIRVLCVLIYSLLTYNLKFFF